MKVNDTRTLSPDAQEQLRRRVVAAIRNEGMKKSHAAKAFGVSRTSVDSWIESYEERGSAGLGSRKRGPKSASRLKGHQAATAVRLITDRCPDQLKLPFFLWTREAVARLLDERFGLKVSVWTAGRYLKRWGMSPQKPVRRAYERDPAAVKRWLEEEYPAIAARAKAEKAEIHWGDEMGMRSDHSTGTSYGRIGQTPVVMGTGKRFSCNMISTITNRGRLSFMVFKGKFEQPVMIQFLARLLRQVKRKVFLIIDGHPVHRGVKVKRWVAASKGRMELFFLPGYSPELNPDELLNQDVKSNAVGRRRPRDQPELMRTVRSYLRGTQRQPHVVANYFKEKHVAYAA